MTEEEIRKIVFSLLKAIAPETEPSELKPDEIYREVLDIDSFDALRFIVSLKENLGIEIPEADYGKITTLDTLINYLLLHKSA
jgi:acyl carrier protein